MDECDIIARWLRLRRVGLLFPLLHEPGGYFYTFDNDFNPWGSRTRIPMADLLAQIVAEEQIFYGRLKVSREDQRG